MDKIAFRRTDSQESVGPSSRESTTPTIKDSFEAPSLKTAGRARERGVFERSKKQKADISNSPLEEAVLSQDMNKIRMYVDKLDRNNPSDKAMLEAALELIGGNNPPPQESLAGAKYGEIHNLISSALT